MKSTSRRTRCVRAELSRSHTCWCGSVNRGSSCAPCARASKRQTSPQLLTRTRLSAPSTFINGWPSSVCTKSDTCASLNQSWRQRLNCELPVAISNLRFSGYSVPRAQQTAERLRRCATVQLMRVGPSEPACRSRFQTTFGGFVSKRQGRERGRKRPGITGSGDRQEEDRKGTTDEVSKRYRRCPKPQPYNYCGTSSDATCLRAERHPA